MFPTIPNQPYSSEESSEIGHSLESKITQQSAELDFEYANKDRKRKLVQNLCKVLFVLHLMGAPTYVLSPLISGQWIIVTGAAVLLLTSLIYLVSYRIAQKGSLLWAGWLNVVAITMALLSLVGLFGATSLPIPALFCFPLVLSLIMLDQRSGLIVALGGTVFLCLAYVSESVFKIFTPAVKLNQDVVVIGNLVCIGFTLPGIFALLVVLLNSQTKALREQYRRVQESNRELSRRQRMSEEMSQQVMALTIQLESLAQEQASSTQEQVGAVGQVTSSMEELNETANQIAAASVASSQAAQKTLRLADQIKKVSHVSNQTAQEGYEAVEQANDSVKAVRNKIELMGQRLLQLTQQTRQVGSVIEIIEEIADETHLLALNASIEAAGTSNEYLWGAADGGAAVQTVNVRGERFGVIAQEVKDLADRSRLATKEVQGAVAATVLVAEETKKEASSALLRSEIVSGVINNLNQVIAESDTTVGEILGVASEVSQRCEEISLATNQQRSANIQILQTMHSISELSRQNAGDLGGLVVSTRHLNSRVSELNRVLDE